AVLGYQTANTDVRASLEVARRHLLPVGILFGDVWYEPAVLSERPGDRVRVVDVPPDGQLIRVASSELDIRAHSCLVRYRVWRLQGGRVLEQTTENHRMRFFFPLELELLLADAGFELVRLGAFPVLEESPTASTWNVALVAR